MYEVWVTRKDGIHIVGQYHDEAQALRSAGDYLARGENAKVVFAS
jgi:hypothetical protein